MPSALAKFLQQLPGTERFAPGAQHYRPEICTELMNAILHFQ
jgi:uncharacterized protein with NAD-binding domain and iron-sulfur cluster